MHSAECCNFLIFFGFTANVVVAKFDKVLHLLFGGSDEIFDIFDFNPECVEMSWQKRWVDRVSHQLEDDNNFFHPCSRL